MRRGKTLGAEGKMKLVARPQLPALTPDPRQVPAQPVSSPKRGGLGPCPWLQVGRPSFPHLPISLSLKCHPRCCGLREGETGSGGQGPGPASPLRETPQARKQTRPL